MFESWSPWTWVALAWAEFLLAHAGYLVYLRWRAKRLNRGDKPLND